VSVVSAICASPPSGVVLQSLPVGVGDLFDRGADVGLRPHTDRVLPARALQAIEDVVAPEPRIGPQQLGGGRARARDAGDELVDEAQRAPGAVGRPPAKADVQDLAAVGPGGEERVVAALAGVAETGALLRIAVDLPDEAVQVDDEAPGARPGPGGPRPAQRLGQHAIQLAHVPEGERAQERPQRRRRRQRAEQRPQAPGPQDVAVIDRVGAQEHRRQKRHHLASRIGRPRPLSEPDAALHQRLDLQPRRQRHRQHDPGVRDGAVIVEGDPHAIQSDRPCTMKVTSRRRPRLLHSAVKVPAAQKIA
jgi:hypothetical protein